MIVGIITVVSLGTLASLQRGGINFQFYFRITRNSIKILCSYSRSRSQSRVRLHGVMRAIANPCKHEHWLCSALNTKPQTSTLGLSPWTLGLSPL